MASSAPVTLSWAEVLLMLLLVLGGWGAWTLGVRYLGDQPAAATANRADASGDTPLLQARTDSDRLREALLKETLEVARAQAQVAWLQGRYPGLAPNPPAGASPVPDDARAGHDLAARNLYVSSQLTPRDRSTPGHRGQRTANATDVTRRGGGQEGQGCGELEAGEPVARPWPVGRARRESRRRRSR